MINRNWSPPPFPPPSWVFAILKLPLRSTTEQEYLAAFRKHIMPLKGLSAIQVLNREAQAVEAAYKLKGKEIDSASCLEIARGRIPEMARQADKDMGGRTQANARLPTEQQLKRNNHRRTFDAHVKRYMDSGFSYSSAFHQVKRERPLLYKAITPRA